MFSNMVVWQGMHSLSYVFDKPVENVAALDLFCFDLYKQFDLGQFEALAGLTRVTAAKLVEHPKKDEAGGSGGG